MKVWTVYHVLVYSTKIGIYLIHKWKFPHICEQLCLTYGPPTQFFFKNGFFMPRTRCFTPEIISVSTFAYRLCLTSTQNGHCNSQTFRCRSSLRKLKLNQGHFLRLRKSFQFFSWVMGQALPEGGNARRCKLKKMAFRWTFWKHLLIASLSDWVCNLCCQIRHK